MIPKSRYDTIDCFLATDEYNDMEVLYNQEVFQQLKDGGMMYHNGCLYLCVNTTIVGLDDLLAQHVAHLFIRDPISLFAEKLEQDVEKETDHFEVSVLCPRSL